MSINLLTTVNIQYLYLLQKLQVPDIIFNILDSYEKNNSKKGLFKVIYQMLLKGFKRTEWMLKVNWHENSLIHCALSISAKSQTYSSFG